MFEGICTFIFKGIFSFFWIIYYFSFKCIFKLIFEGTFEFIFILISYCVMVFRGFWVVIFVWVNNFCVQNFYGGFDTFYRATFLSWI